jgi:hypothetical protein
VRAKHPWKPKQKNVIKSSGEQWKTMNHRPERPEITWNVFSPINTDSSSQDKTLSKFNLAIHVTS